MYMFLHEDYERFHKIRRNNLNDPICKSNIESNTFTKQINSKESNLNSNTNIIKFYFVKLETAAWGSAALAAGDGSTAGVGATGFTTSSAGKSLIPFK